MGPRGRPAQRHARVARRRRRPRRHVPRALQGARRPRLAHGARHARRRWYLIPYVAYWSVEEYIDASRAGLAADVRAYQLEVARVDERKARRAATTPARVQPARAGKKRARAS